MAKRRRRRKKKLSAKDRKKKMLRGSEWILLGILFVAVSEGIVRYYQLEWRYLPYAFAVWMVLIFRLLLKILRFITLGATALLNSINELDYKR